VAKQAIAVKCIDNFPLYPSKWVFLVIEGLLSSCLICRQTLEVAEEIEETMRRNIDRASRAFEEHYLEEVQEALREELGSQQARIHELNRDYRMAGRLDYNERVVRARRMESYQERRIVLHWMQEEPYHGRVDFLPDNDPSATEQTIYVGLTSLGELPNLLVYDWRARICRLYYQSRGEGPAFYSLPNGRHVSGNILLRRSYQFHDGILTKIYGTPFSEEVYTDREVAERHDTVDVQIQASDTMDTFLLRILQEHRTSGRMREIVRSIQAEQDTIIRSDGDVIVVNGPAGSGKTVVALHRAAYLLYHLRSERGAGRVGNMLVISPNAIFSSYISNVLPELYERPIGQLIFDRFVEKTIRDLARKERFNLTSIESKEEYYEKMLVGNEDSPNTRDASPRLKQSYMMVESIERFVERYAIEIQNEFSSIAIDIPETFTVNINQLREQIQTTRGVSADPDNRREVLLSLIVNTRRRTRSNRSSTRNRILQRSIGEGRRVALSSISIRVDKFPRPRRQVLTSLTIRRPKVSLPRATQMTQRNELYTLEEMQRDFRLQGNKPIAQRINAVLSEFRTRINMYSNEPYADSRNICISSDKFERLKGRMHKYLHKSIFELYRELWSQLKETWTGLCDYLQNSGNGQECQRIEELVQEAETTLRSLEQGQISYEDALLLLWLNGLYYEFPSFGNNIQHVIVDEAQDYSRSHYEYFRRCLPKQCRYTIVGDRYQALYGEDGCGDFQWLDQIFPGGITHFNLEWSYRSTKEITEFARYILPGCPPIQSIRATNRKPKLVQVGRGHTVRAIKHLMSQLPPEEYPSVAIVCKTVEEGWEWYQRLSSDREVYGRQISLLSVETTSLGTGLLVAPLIYAKGLEFDAVIIPNASASRYSRESDRNALYVACTRALHDLYLCYEDEASPLLPSPESGLYEQCIYS
jgi:DNA helicase IV